MSEQEVKKNNKEAKELLKQYVFESETVKKQLEKLSEQEKEEYSQFVNNLGDIANYFSKIFARNTENKTEEQAIETTDS